MKSAEIRQRFLDFFAKEGHTVVPSASLIAPDPTLLLVNAGMVPFKPFFLGETKAPYDRAVSVQKCVRTLDIDEVGKTTRHASFFQMCGNFSFGNYFKAGAIDFAWRLLTNSVADGGYGFDPERLWVTVFHDDDESADIWHNQIGIPKERIQRRGMADNFWSMGVPGPCGPCSEIYFDRGEAYGKPGGPISDESRYLEVWNLVFMQFERGAGGGKDDFPIVGELPAKNIDTGMGLERMAAILQGVDNIYEIDTTKMILDRAAALSNTTYGQSESDDIRLRVVADHARTCAFLLNDGVIPGNEGRGYVLRRMMRRVIRSMRLLGLEDPCMESLINVSIDSMKDQYPELETNRDRIVAAAIGEENSFRQTLKSGSARFETAVAEISATNVNVISADRVFEMHDTYGFPFDLTLEMAAERGLTVDADGFKRLMNEQRDRAKADAKSRKAKLADLSVYKAAADLVGGTKFIGYSQTSTEANLGALIVSGKAAKSAKQGDQVEVVLPVTPFYAEGGGQLGDSGRIVNRNGAIIEIDDVQQPISGLYVHSGRVIDGEFSLGENVSAEIDAHRRIAISRAHTATHMIHKAFREKLGESATQMGSENAPGRLRFDFPSPQAVPKSMLADVEQRVNQLLIENLPVTEAYMSQSEAMQIGAMALFGEKYGDEVRVISIGDWAKELCGGTHTDFSGQLGLVTFLSESSIGAGIRRVEALVGSDAHAFLAREHLILNQITELLKVKVDDLPERIDSILNKLKDAEKAVEQQKRNELLAKAGNIVGKPTLISDLKLFAFAAELDLESLRELVSRTKGDNPDAVVVALTSTLPAGLIIGLGDRAISEILDARKLLAAITAQFGGKGGGKPEMTQGSLSADAKPSVVIEQLPNVIASLK
ncbi:MAG: alanine--tRNA ligase [Candidatus Nanopelagicales bacterium]